MTLQNFVHLTEGISYLVAVTYVASFIVFWRYLTGREALAPALARESQPAEMATGDALPATAFIHPAHGWLTLDNDGLVRVGVDAFLARAIGRVDAVTLPQAGDTLTAGDSAFALVQGKRKADISTPVSGVVVEVNAALAKDATLIKASPYAAGWALRVRPSALSDELPRLNIAKRARAWLAEEAARLSELVVSSGAKERTLGPTMADGGEVIDGALEQLNDDDWHTFFSGGDVSSTQHGDSSES